MSDLSTRLKESRIRAGKSQAQIADAVGMKQPSYQALESGKNQKSAFLTEIARELGVDAYWLQTGEIDDMQKASSSNEPPNVSTNNKKLYKIPVLDFVQAGLFNSVAYDGINPKGETYTTYEAKHPREVFSLTVEGLSMAPDFMPGDELIIDASLAPKPGCLVIAQNDDIETTFKKYRVTGYDEYGREEFELVPLNPDFPTLSSKNRSTKIIGVVVQHMRKFKY